MHFLVAVAAAAGVAAVYAACVRTPLGQAVDTAVMLGSDVHLPRVTDVLSRTLNATSLVSLFAVCIAAAAIGFVRRRADLALAAALLVIGANGTTQLLKARLPRPDLDGYGMANSFPSGHTTAAASVAFALILVLPFAVRGTVALIGAGYVAIIAVATVWAAWHRPSDTIAALLVVLAWSALASTIVRARRAGITGVTARPNRAAMLVFAIAGVVCAAAGLLGLGAMAVAARTTVEAVPGHLTFAAGVAVITAAVAGVFAVWTRLAAGDRPAYPDGPPVPAAARSEGLPG